MSMNKPASVFIFLLIFSYTIATAQYQQHAVQNGNSLSFSVMGSRSAFAEEIFSSGAYRVWMPEYIISFSKSKVNKRQFLTAGYASGKFSNDIDGGYTASQRSFLLDYAMLFSLLPASKKLGLHLGGNIGAAFNQRKYEGFINSNESFEFVLSLGAAADFNLLLSEKNDLRFYLRNHFRLPFLSLIYQPSFSLDETEGTINGKNGLSNFFSSSKLGSFNKYFSVSNTLALTKEISTTTDVALLYDFLYRKISSQRAVRHLKHSVGVSIIFHL